MVVKNDHGPLALVAIILITIVCVAGALLAGTELLNPTTARIAQMQAEEAIRPTQIANDALEQAQREAAMEANVQQVLALSRALPMLALAVAIGVLGLGVTYRVVRDANPSNTGGRRLEEPNPQPAPEGRQPVQQAVLRRNPARARANPQPLPVNGGKNGIQPAGQVLKNTGRFTKIEMG